MVIYRQNVSEVLFIQHTQLEFPSNGLFFFIYFFKDDSYFQICSIGWAEILFWQGFCCNLKKNN